MFTPRHLFLGTNWKRKGGMGRLHRLCSLRWWIMKDSIPNPIKEKTMVDWSEEGKKH
jgi:hypothetical protein